MALGKDIGNFSFKITSVSFGENGATVDVDGTADNFGTVLGTLTFTGDPAAPGGALSWRGQSYPDGGEAAGSVGEGSFETLSNHKWRTRLIINTTDGQVFASDGELDLATRSLKGKTLEWS